MALLLAGVGASVMFLVEPEFWWLGAGVPIVGMGIYYPMMADSGSKWILNMSQARPATKEEDQILRNVGEEMAIAAGITMPDIYVIEDSAPNAFATGWEPKKSAVCFTTGIIKKLNRDELQGVMAHEIAHIRNYDTRLMMALVLTVGLIVFLRDAVFRSGLHRRTSRRDSKADGIIMVIVIIFLILAPLVAVLLKMAVSRKREYLADATAAQLTRYPDALADALEKLEADSEPLEAANRATMHLFIVNPFKKTGFLGETNLFSTHPPTRERINRLRSMGFLDHDREQQQNQLENVYEKME